MTDYSIDIIKDTSYTIELNEQGPQGIQGERGIQGEQGPVGPKGDKGDVGEKGDTGDTGVSVVGVEEISKVGLVATYRMMFSNREYFDYQVTDGSIDGLTREAIINIIGYEPASYTSVEGLTTRVSTLEERVENLTASKFPNVVIIGTPHIEGGQVSGFSNADYLQFPFVDISRGLPFDIYFSFTTGSDVVTQQNVLDSHFGIALAIQNSKGIMALSSNGTSWDIGNVTGTNTILPNTTYYAKCSWTGTQYNASLSTNDTTYVPDMVIDSTLTTNKTTIFIGGSPDLFGAGTSHPFKGTINFNNSRVDVQGATVWEGMADVGLASRANVSLNNLDEVGEKRFTDIQIALDGKQDKGKSGSGLELCDIGISLYVDETKGLRRYLNGQIVDINTNTQAFLNRLLQIQATNPEYFTTEDNWQAESTLNIDGCVYKFVLNYDSTGTNVVSVRLPKYPDYVEINAGGTLPVVGNGMALGVKTNSYSASLSMESVGNNTGVLRPRQPIGLSISGTPSFGEPIPATNAYTVGITTDPTKSGIQTTLKQTKLKVRYFIQIATGSETENNIINDIELNNPYSLFDSKYSDHELNNLSWLKSEGQWNSKAVYPDAYDKILENVNNCAKGFLGQTMYMWGSASGGYMTTSLTPIVGSVVYSYGSKKFVGYVTGVDLTIPAISFRDDVAGISYTNIGRYTPSDESSSAYITDYDFVLNTADETFRLPLKTKLASGKAVVGNGYALGLTNGTSDLLLRRNDTDSDTRFGGYMSNQLPFVANIHPAISDSQAVGITPDPTKSGIELSDSGLYLYYYVGETVQNANLIDAGRIGEILPTKLDASKVKAYVTETYQNGSSWYRIYSDGWCEQGGYASSASAITLLKSFKDTNYTITVALLADVNKDYTSKTITGFSIGASGSWQASGYIA